MIVGTALVRLRLPENGSLKGKRAVIRSLCTRLQNELRVAAAEVDDHDLWQVASIGIACVSNSGSHAEALLGAVERLIAGSHHPIELVSFERSIDTE
ncbi:MAG: DUF503 domain-containing protein [Chloroflexi bacterium]|nr:DUF503 domain-containing protein [Chloroflexota bacterium]